MFDGLFISQRFSTSNYFIKIILVWEKIMIDIFLFN